MGRGYRWMYHITGLPGWMRGRGWGGPHAGRWHGAGPYWPGPWGTAPTVEDEVAFLKDEAEGLRNHLERIERRISELEKPSE